MPFKFNPADESKILTATAAAATAATAAAAAAAAAVATIIIKLIITIYHLKKIKANKKLEQIRRASNPPQKKKKKKWKWKTSIRKSLTASSAEMLFWMDCLQWRRLSGSSWKSSKWVLVVVINCNQSIR